MSECMTFPDTFEEFAESYGLVDDKEVYTNGAELIPVFRVKQWLEHAQPEIIHCKGCKWWDKYSDTRGYCLAAKHGYWSKHWDISIRRTYDADWYCADAERSKDD